MKKTYNGKVWMVIAGVLIVLLWKLVELILYGHATNRLSDDIMFIVWLLTLRTAFKMGKGEDLAILVAFRDWWAREIVGVTPDEYAKILAARKEVAKAKATVVVDNNTGEVIDADFEPVEKQEQDPPAQEPPAQEEASQEVPAEKAPEMPIDTPVLKVSKAKRHSSKNGKKVVVLNSKVVKPVAQAPAKQEAAPVIDEISGNDDEIADMM